MSLPAPRPPDVPSVSPPGSLFLLAPLAVTGETARKWGGDVEDTRPFEALSLWATKVYLAEQAAQGHWHGGQHAGWCSWEALPWHPPDLGSNPGSATKSCLTSSESPHLSHMSSVNWHRDPGEVPEGFGMV